MKKHISIILLLAVTWTAFGLYINYFKSWSNLIDGSPDIVIARCTATPDFTPPGVKPKMVDIVGGGWLSDIEVISVLKGKTKPSLSHLISFYKPHQGELFVAFANYTMSGTNSLYSANEGYQVIPLNSDFRISDLNGKTLDEQIQLILKSRLKDLDDEITRDNEEKQRLESGLKK
jgi:hypothetical protein